MTDDRVPIVAEVFRLFFGSRKKAAPRALDLRGFRMIRREAAEWIRAVDACMDVDKGPDSHPSLADTVETASRDDLLMWSCAWRRSLNYEMAIGAQAPSDPFVAQSRLVSALMLAAWRGPDFHEIPEAERLRSLWRMATVGGQ